jgi:3-oxoacyl-[acyl-carrier-protein] synthase-3
MVKAGIVGLGYYVPPKIMTNDDWASLVDTSDEWITTKTGIKERRIANKDVCTSDLAVLASLEAIKDANIKPDDIDLIILATSSPDVPLSSTASIVQHKLNCNNE